MKQYALRFSLLDRWALAGACARRRLWRLAASLLFMRRLRVTLLDAIMLAETARPWYPDLVARIYKDPAIAEARARISAFYDKITATEDEFHAWLAEGADHAL